ncbi:MAG TPA: hypothetical protein DD624_08950 [Alphaproteobacteria bacterium]|nr:hypothetical protein [Alphaproteobacteria bacterium]
MAEWKTIKLGEVCNLIAGYAFKSCDFGDYPKKVVKITNIEPPYVNMQALTGFNDKNYDIKKLEKYRVSSGDYILAMTGATIGKIGRIRLGSAYINQRVLKFCPKKIDNDFLFYILSMNNFSKYIINNIDSESAQANISASTIGKYTFPLPPLDVQKRIAGILGALDDRIDVLRRENVVLEQMAQAVFQSWFVDFDIVRAKADGLSASEVCGKYRITPELYALFPSALTPDGIPQGWEKKKLGELVQNVKKSVKPSVETEQKPYVPIDCIATKSLTLYDFKEGKEAQSSLISFEPHDILFGAMRAYFHKVCIAPFAGTTRSTVFCLRPKKLKDFSFALLSVFQNRCIAYASQNSKGTTMPYAVWDNNLSEYQTEASAEDVRTAFNEYLENSFNKMMVNAQQIRALSATRDALLPKLMSGEIEV